MDQQSVKSWWCDHNISVFQHQRGKPTPCSIFHYWKYRQWNRTIQSIILPRSLWTRPIIRGAIGRIEPRLTIRLMINTFEMTTRNSRLIRDEWKKDEENKI